MKEFIIVLLVLAATAGAVVWYQTSVFENTGIQQQASTHYGATVSIGQGSARTWIKLDGNGQPLALGVSLTESALSGLPQDPPVAEYALQLPREAADTLFDHVTLDWNAHGHEPAGVYDVPHFDVHFYMIDEATRLVIAADDPGFEVAPDPAYLPQDYAQVPGGVPQMGVHWVDLTAPEFNGQPFSATFIYGSYWEEVTFFEPMVALDFLKQKPQFSAAIRQPQRYPQPGYAYPTSYSVNYDKEDQTYHISLEGFVER